MHKSAQPVLLYKKQSKDEKTGSERKNEMKGRIKVDKKCRFNDIIRVECKTRMTIETFSFISTWGLFTRRRPIKTRFGAFIIKLYDLNLILCHPHLKSICSHLAVSVGKRSFEIALVGFKTSGRKLLIGARKIILTNWGDTANRFKDFSSFTKNNNWQTHQMTFEAFVTVHQLQLTGN